MRTKSIIRIFSWCLIIVLILSAIMIVCIAFITHKALNQVKNNIITLRKNDSIRILPGFDINTLDNSRILVTPMGKPSVWYFVYLSSLDGIADAINMHKYQQYFKNEINFYWLYSCSDIVLKRFTKDHLEWQVDWILDEKDSVYEFLDGKSLILDENKKVQHVFTNTEDQYFRLHLSNLSSVKKYYPIAKPLSVGDDISYLNIYNESQERIWPSECIINFVSPYCKACFLPEDKVKTESGFGYLLYLMDYRARNIGTTRYRDFVDGLAEVDIEYAFVLNVDDFDISFPSAFIIDSKGMIVDTISALISHNDS